MEASDEAPPNVNAARLVASRAVAARQWGVLLNIWIGLRAAEIFANAFLLGVVLWIVEPWVLVLPFALLWYLPAAVRTGSLVAPLRYPLLNFVVDDHSMIGFHPGQRGARVFYALQVVRVLLLVLIALACTKWSPVPTSIKESLVNEGAMDSFMEHAFMAHRWAALGVLAVCLAMVHLLAISVMLCLPTSPLSAPRDDEALQEIDKIAAQVQNACLLPVEECYEKIRDMSESHGLKLAGIAPTFGPSVGAMIHLFVDLQNSYTLAKYGDPVLACLLVGAVALTILYRFRATQGQPQRVLLTAWESWNRGMWTDEYLMCIRGDKGVQALPALILKVYSLPFASKNLFSFANAACSVIGTVFSTAQFVFLEYDLGVEIEGAHKAFEKVATKEE